MEAGNAPELLVARLLFADKPLLDNAVLTEALRQRFPQVDSPGDTLAYFFPEYPVTFADGKKVAASLMIAGAEHPSGSDVLAGALQQSWHWPDAEVVVSTCQHEVVVTDFMTRTLDYKVRVELFQKALDAIIEVLQPLAIYFPGSDKLVEPRAYLQRGGAVLEGLVNVRFFNLTDSAAPEMLLDTLGLHALGLPDLQIRFANLDPNQVVGVLMNYSYYLFENGSILAEGNTVQGLTPAENWVCRHTDALLAPERLMVQLEISQQ